MQSEKRDNPKKFHTAWIYLGYILKRQNFRTGEQISGCQGFRAEEVTRRGVDMDMGMNKTAWGILVVELFYILTVVVNTRTYMCDKIV